MAGEKNESYGWTKKSPEKPSGKKHAARYGKTVQEHDACDAGVLECWQTKIRATASNFKGDAME